MASDKGKPGVVDMFDVAAQICYMEEHYNGTVELNLSTAFPRGRGVMLLCASFVGNKPSPPRVTSDSIEVPCSPGVMREMPRLAHELLFSVQETVEEKMRQSFTAKD